MLLRQIFPKFITFITIIRHPIERVLSSYRMKLAQFSNQAKYWNMKSWLEGTAVAVPKDVTGPTVVNGPRGRHMFLRTSQLEEVRYTDVNACHIAYNTYVLFCFTCRTIW